MSTKIIVAIAATLAWGAASMTPALAAHGGGFSHVGGAHLGVSHVGVGHFGGYRVGAGPLHGRVFYPRARAGLYGAYPYSLGCSPYQVTYYPCY
jgi:hypothetical protein